MSTETPITDFNEIDISTKEGKLLMAAMIKLSTESQTDKTPYEILLQVQGLAEKTYVFESKFISAISDAMKVLTDELRKDKSEGSYYYSWQANIAMAFKDEAARKMNYSNASIKKELIHEIANQAARNFLDTLCAKPTPTNNE